MSIKSFTNKAAASTFEQELRDAGKAFHVVVTLFYNVVYNY